MSVRQLYQLQCLELDIEAREKALLQSQSRLGESEEVRQARAKLAQAKAEIEALSREQRSNEWAVADLSAKMTLTRESLYSGRIRNPKELTSLQQEFDSLKAQCDPLEEKALALMEKVEVVQAGINHLGEELTLAEAKSREEQKTLLAEIGGLKQELAELKEKKQQFMSTIPAAELASYHQLKGRIKPAVARVEQGTCGRCRLSLSSAEIQRTRGGTVVHCSSCGRLLFFE